MSKTRDLVLTALLVAVVFVATYFRVPTGPTGGLVHLGTVALFVICVVFGPKKGAIAGAFGMALFNLTTEWAVWAPYTFVIRIVMGYIMGSVAHFGGAGGKKPVRNVLALVAGGAWFIPAAYAAELMIFRVQWQVPVASIPGNVMQLVLALVAGLPLATLISRHRPR
ncbi:MAG: ECF transporter S component [Defluviitaleaceae bacterium]|nr:ECF transporter S component [Defluviitaleaceae bacterium]